MGTHTCNPSTWENEAGSLCLQLTRSRADGNPAVPTDPHGEQLDCPCVLTDFVPYATVDSRAKSCCWDS